MKINALIVVEGKTDIDFLSSFIEANFYAVNGSAVNEKDLNFIKAAKEKTNVIVLTDPDFPGMKIRNYLNQNIDGLENAYVRKNVSIKRGKVGVAESTKEEVLNAISHTLKYQNRNLKDTISNEDLIELGLNGDKNSAKLRLKLCDNLNIGYSNSKTLLKKINLLQLSKKDVEEILNA